MLGPPPASTVTLLAAALPVFVAAALDWGVHGLRKAWQWRRAQWDYRRYAWKLEKTSKRLEAAIERTLSQT